MENSLSSILALKHLIQSAKEAKKLKYFLGKIAIYILPFLERHPDFSDWRDQMDTLQTKDFSILFELDQNAVKELEKISYPKRNFIDDKKLLVDMREPFNLLADAASRPRRWGRLDSNQRRPKSRGLQPLAIGRYATPPINRLLAVRLELTTVRLQIGCSTS